MLAPLPPQPLPGQDRTEIAPPAPPQRIGSYPPQTLGTYPPQRLNELVAEDPGSP